jgi:hypothetical protein
MTSKRRKRRGKERGKKKNAKSKNANSRTTHLDSKRPEDAAPKGVHFPIKRNYTISSGSLKSFLEI